MNTRGNNSSRRAGFTIIEVILAMGILVLGATAIIGFLTYGASVGRHAQLRTQAASAVEAVIADLGYELFPFEDGELGDPIEIDDREVPGAPGVVYSARAFPNPENDIEYRVDVHLTWQSAGVRRSKEFQILQLRELPFGERLRREFVERQPMRSEKPAREAGTNGEAK